MGDMAEKWYKKVSDYLTPSKVRWGGGGGKVGVEGSGGESTQRDTESSDISNKNMNEVDSKDNNTNWRCC